MKNVLKISALLLIVCLSINVQAKDTSKAIAGTWKYEATDAPYEYQTGKVVFYEEEGVSKVKVVTDYDVIKGENLKIEGNKIVFNAYVENSYITVKIELKEDQLVGNVDTPEGVLAITLKKEKV